MARKRLKLSDQIRRAVKSSGKSRYAIFKATGIDQATLSRFMSRQDGLPMKTLDRLAEFLDLNLARGKSGTTKKGQ
jgi:transcriptional regulator with XRE-family HTH domain